jgi:signal transduction histidine kinase/ligand-binding sensor domain-containing protein
MKKLKDMLAGLLPAVCAIVTAFAGTMECRAATNKLGELIVARATKGDSTPSLFDHYEPRFWDIRDGLPFNRVSAIYVDHQNYLWLGSFFGISRFNGQDFVAFDPHNRRSLRSDTVTAILPEDDSHFWVSTKKGLYRSDGREFTEIPLPPPYDDISGMAKTSDGALWLATWGGLVRHANQQSAIYGRTNGLKQSMLQAIRVHGNSQVLVFGAPYSQLFDPVRKRFGDLPWDLQAVEPLRTWWSELLGPDAGGYVWYQNRKGIYRFIPGDPAELVEAPNPDDYPAIRLLALDDSGNVWVSHADGLVIRYAGGLKQSINLNHRYGVTLVDTFLQHNDDYWLGSEEGLVLLKKRRVDNYSSLNGLPDHNVVCIAQLTDDKFLVGTGRGSAIIDRSSQEVTAVQVNTADQRIRSVCPAPDGGFWISNEHHGPLLIDTNSVVHLSPAHSLWNGLLGGPPRRISEMIYDSKGFFWIGSKMGATRVDPAGNFIHYDSQSNPPLPVSDIRVIYEHHDGSIWMGSEGGGLAILKDGAFQLLTTADGLSGNEVFALTRDPDGETVWVGTDKGVSRIRNGTIRSIKENRGIPVGTINQILIDRYRNLWMTSLKGAHRITVSELNDAIDDDTHEVMMMTVDSSDGMLNAETNGEHQPAGIIDREGHLWIPTIKAVSTFDPSLFENIPQPLPPIIERITLDRKRIYDNTTNDPSFLLGKLVLLPNQGDLLEIELSAPSVSLTDTAHYQVNLGGDDNSGWLEVKAPRALYTTLKPGSYAFQAQVATAKNKWSEAVTPFRIERRPFFYQTWEFYVFVGLAAIGVGLLLHTRRIRVVEKIQRLEQKSALISERERIARDMHDDLGSRLTHISLIAEISEREDRQLTKEQTHELNIAARQAARAVEEIVWAAKPDNDNSDNTIDFLIQYAEHLLSAAQIACRNNSGENLPHTYLSPEHRHAVFLAFKEAINNVIKHSNAAEVKLSVSSACEKFTVRISDNGDGFDSGQVHRNGGNGLKNMEARMAAIDGTCSVRSTVNEGTVVKIIFFASRKNETSIHRNRVAR